MPGPWSRQGTRVTVAHMARPQGGLHNERNSTVLAVRIPNALAEAVKADAATKGMNLPEWHRQVIEQALHREPKGVGSAQVAGYDEGKRQGWAHANAAFREALKVAAATLKAGA